MIIKVSKNDRCEVRCSNRKEIEALLEKLKGTTDYLILSNRLEDKNVRNK